MCMHCTEADERWHEDVWLEGGPSWMVDRCPHSRLNPSLPSAYPMDWELTIYNSGSSPLPGKARSQWIKCDHSSAVNAVIALWTVAIDVNGQYFICHKAGHTICGMPEMEYVHL